MNDNDNYSDNNELEIEISENDYEEFLNEIYPEITIGELIFYPGQIIRKLDPVAFQCGKNDYEDSLNRE